jgi:hypothetical protein
MSFTIEDFEREYLKEQFWKLTPEEQQEVLRLLPPETILGTLSDEQIRQYLNRRAVSRSKKPRTSRRKKMVRWSG